MVAAVGKVLQKKGYAGLDAAAVARECGVDKKLVWTYFGGLDNLVEQFIQQRDFWKQAAKDNVKRFIENPEAVGKADIDNLLQQQFDTLLKDRVLQRIIHWELGENKKILRSIADQREEIGEELFAIIEPHFKKKGTDIRALLALLIGGIYYLSLHGRNNGSLFCGIDINEESGKDRIAKAIREIIYTSFETA